MASKKQREEAKAGASFRGVFPVNLGSDSRVLSRSEVHYNGNEIERRAGIESASSVYKDNVDEGVNFIAFPKQELFLGCDHDEVLYGGARGGAKSYALMIDAALHVRKWHMDGDKVVVDKQSIDYGDYVAIILRRKFTDIYRNFKPMCDPVYEKLGGIWAEKAQCYNFPSGAKIYLGHCDEAKDVDKYIGGNYTYLGVEEINQFPEKWIRDIGGSVRSTNFELKPFKRYTTNPGGVGHIWLKKRFIDKCPPVEGKVRWNEVHDIEYTELNPGDPYRDEDGNYRWFIPSLVFDNPALLNNDLQYINFLKSLDPLRKKMWLHGKWDEMSGLFFNEWSKEHHIVDEREVEIDPDNCRIYRCVDYGTSNPFVCLWAQVDRQGRVLFFDEIYEAGYTPTMQAEAILSRTRNWRLTESDIDLTVVDPSMKTATQDMGMRMRSVLEIYGDAGVEHIALGNNSRVQGWGVFKDYLKIPEPDENGDCVPYIRFSTKCKRMIETIPTLVTSENNIEDVDTDGDDHGADAARYLLMFIQIPFVKKAIDDTPLWLRELQKRKGIGRGDSLEKAWTA